MNATTGPVFQKPYSSMIVVYHHIKHICMKKLSLLVAMAIGIASCGDNNNNTDAGSRSTTDSSGISNPSDNSSGNTQQQMDTSHMDTTHMDTTGNTSGDSVGAGGTGRQGTGGSGGKRANTPGSR